MVRDSSIPFDLESTPLQIKTNSTAGSWDRIFVRTFTTEEDEEWSYIGTVGVMFTSPMRYYIAYCTYGWTSLPVQPPDEVDKIWTIQKNTTTLSIECNGVEVNNKFSESSDHRCLSRWGGDVVKNIKFYSSGEISDTASDSYRAKPTGNEQVNHCKAETS